jgi:uncharacterized protein
LGDPTVIAAVCAAVALAGCVQGLSGFGSGLVLVSIVPWFVDITFAVPFAGVFSYMTVLAMAWRHRRHVRLRRALPLVLGLFPGVPLGMAFLQGVDAGMATGALGAVLVVYASWSLLGARREEPVRVSERWAPAFGFAGGVLGGAFNCSGPPVVLYSTLQDWGKGETVGMLQSFFLCQGAMTLTGFTLTGLITVETLTWNAWMFPALVGGIWVGDRLHHRVDEAVFRKVVMVGLMLMGLAFLARLVVASL